MGSNRRKVMKSIPQIDQQESSPKNASEAKMKHQISGEPFSTPAMRLSTLKRKNAL